MKKIFGLFLLAGTFLSLVNINQTNDFKETTLLDNNNCLALNTIRKENVNEELSYSKMFSQVAYNEKTESYYLRFATAIKGEINSISYTRIVEGKEDKIVESNVVYYAISANNQIMYYDGTNEKVSSDEKLKGEYYWTCYTIKFAKDSEFLSKDINLTLNVNDTKIASKTTSLNSEIQPKTYTFEAEDAYIFNSDGTAKVKDKSTASGGKYIDSLSNDKGSPTVTFYINSSSACEANLIMRMGHASERKLSDIFSINVNNEKYTPAINAVFGAYDEATEEKYFAWRDTEIGSISLKEGNNKIEFTKASTCLNFDAIKLVSTADLEWSKNDKTQYLFEAEDADLVSINGQAKVANSSTASGGKYIDSLGNDDAGASLTFNIYAEDDCIADLTIVSAKHYSTARQVDSYFKTRINGNIVNTNYTIEPNTNPDDKPTIYTTFYDFKILENIILHKGENTISFERMSQFVLNLDAIKLDSSSKLLWSYDANKCLKIEAEFTTLDGNAKATTETGMNNPSSGKFVGGLSGSKGNLTFVVNAKEACEATFIMCYGNRTNDTTDRKFSSKFILTVNGNNITSNTVFNNGTENNYFGWEEYTICTLDLTTGDNIIKLESTGVASSNIDYFKLQSETKLMFKRTY